MITRDEAYELLKKYNKDEFHLHHGRMVEGSMRYFANKLGYGDEEEYWAIVGLLHDIDFEMWPEEHCLKAPELLREGGVSEDMIHAIVSHGYGLCCDVKPEREMEKVLFACDELTGLIGAAALMRPSKSCQDMELKSLKKKFKDKRFAAGCDREVIKQGAEMLGWDLDYLLSETLEAMKTCDPRLGLTPSEQPLLILKDDWPSDADALTDAVKALTGLADRIDALKAERKQAEARKEEDGQA